MRFLFCLSLLVLIDATAAAQTLYRYKDTNGNWKFSDRPPAHETKVESRRLVTRNYTPQVKVINQETVDGAVLIATNEWHCPVQLSLEFTNVRNVEAGLVEPIDIVLPPDSTFELMELLPQDATQRFGFQYRYTYIHGDPTTAPNTAYLYALPFAKGTEYEVTQAFPSRITHTSASSLHAIDFAMPEGTPVYAAREGVVFATAYENYEGGTDKERDLPKANVVRIAHDDGTMAVYAHLSWNAIRVKPGQKVKRGQYIADSGNTGFSSGPHLHFALHANTGMKIESVPVTFAGAGNQPVQALTGEILYNIE